MNITIGPPVSPKDFFDREQLLDELWSVIESQSVLLAAPRRVGKSSLMLKVKQEPRFGFKVLWLEEARAAGRMLRELAIAKESLLKSSLLATYQEKLGQAGDTPQFDLLFTWLSDDFYLEEIAGGRVQFKSRWMRDWWRTYHATRP